MLVVNPQEHEKLKIHCSMLSQIMPLKLEGHGLPSELPSTLSLIVKSFRKV